MAPYARLEVNLILFGGAVLVVVTAALVGWWAMLPAICTLVLVSFYRDPPRRPMRRPNVLVAPADGRVVVLRREPAAEPRETTLRIDIFLSVFDVHVNRAPCGGRVIDVQHRPGRFISALRPAAAELNESNTLTIAPPAPLPGPIVVRQIAGRLARRIVCAVAPPQRVRIGQRIGMIKLGSRVELRAPQADRWQVHVRPGQHVRAGETVLAELDPR
ncbi:MAG: phosphatidylserine decarboxylase [Phycisphaerae bacterium]|jgi:phosphatidylserine decarboxylase|nr:phosphatidylserine decarboxylase family protein [Phycisphaerae bacterium]MCZ2401049.1 phosphatidylserine decarboxylase [Phycisphaerae bacterium]